MGRHLYIAGADRWQDLIKDTLQIEQVLTQTIDACFFQVRGDKPTAGEEVRVVDDDLGCLFGGIIDKVELAQDIWGLEQVWKVEAQDYTYMLNRRKVVETYENMAADAVVKDIITKYGGGSFTTNHVCSGAPTIEMLVFDYTTPSDALKEIADYCGWDYYIDYDKDVWFFNPANEASPAPMSLKPGDYFRNIKHSINQEGLRNRVYVRGGTMLSDPWTYEVKADDSARAWVLPHKPHDITVMVAGVAKTCGIENVHEESEYDFLMNYQEKYVRCSSQTPTPAEGVTLAFTYRYDIDVITMVEDIASQQVIAAVQGGDGVYEHVIVDDSLTTIDAAEAAGNADLREHANPQVRGSFETEVPGWAPGQLVTINLPDRGIQGTFLVQKVTITPCTPDKWTYRVEYGGRLLGIADWLQALWKAQQKKKLNETALLHKFHYGAETAKVTDEVGPTIIHRIPAIVLPKPTFSRSSVAYKQDGTQVAVNTPRFEPGKFGQAVMVEEGTTNLLLYSEQFDNTAWTKGQSTITPNAITGPFGVQTADKLIANTTNDIHSCFQKCNGLSENTKYTFSVYLKKGEYKYANVSIDQSGRHNRTFVIVDLDTGQFVNGPKVIGNGCALVQAKSEYVANGFWRVQITVNSGSNTSLTAAVWAIADGYEVQDVSTFVGNGTSGIYLFGAQFEAKSYVSSYMPTTSSIVTRSPETLTIPTAGVLNPQEGTVEYWVYVTNSLKDPSRFYPNLFAVFGQGGSSYGWFAVDHAQNTDNWRLATAATGTITDTLLISDSLTPVGWNCFAITWAKTDVNRADCKFYVNGNLAGSKNMPFPTSFNPSLYIGWLENLDARRVANTLFDDLRISSRARTDTDEEIAAAYASGQPLPVDEWTTYKLSFDNEIMDYVRTPLCGFVVCAA